MKGDADVVENGETWEETDVLEGAGDAVCGDVVGLFADDAVLIEKNFPFGRLIDAGDEIENGGFAGAVGTDEADEFTFADLEIQGRDGSEAAEADGAATEFEK